MKKLLYISIFIFILIFAGCKKVVVSPSDTPEVPKEDLTLHLKASAKELSKTTVPENKVMPDNITFGIYIQEKDLEGDLPQTRNKKYKSAEGSLVEEDGDKVLVGSGKSYFVYGYSPYKDVATDGLGHTKIPFTHGDDLLLPQEVEHLTNVSPTTNTVTLAFQHRTVQVQVVLEAKENKDAPVTTTGIPANTEIKISGFKKKATLNLLTQEILPVQDGGDTTITYSKNSDETTLETPFTCFFLTGVDPKTLTVTITGIGAAPLSIGINIAAWLVGKAYKVPIYLIGTAVPGLAVGAITAVKWERIEENMDMDVPI